MLLQHEGEKMKICVYGLFHLGLVTAASLADRGFNVIGLDCSIDVVNKLLKGESPIFEPGLNELLKKGLDSKKLTFTTDSKSALNSADVLWITYDTPVNSNDKADTNFVLNHIKDVFGYLKSNTLVLISSQLPVGSTRKLQLEYNSCYGVSSTFAYIPENLRLGDALITFNKPDRIIVGIDKEGIDKVKEILKAISSNIVWMSIESAEMTKHSLNAFLATSITFANEIAIICEKVGVDYKEVERGLKSDSRIGKNAYLRAGSAYSGGTLARDVKFLNDISKLHNIPSVLIKSLRISNEQHKKWNFITLLKELGTLKHKRIAVLGLTYKTGTDTLRRSSSIELCKKLIRYNAIVTCHDPYISRLPNTIRTRLQFSNSIMNTIKDSDAIVIATEHNLYKSLSNDDICRNIKNPIIIDANRFLESQLGIDSRIRYISVGRVK